jgi:diguanylate cyclase (GGDEF)-like protein/PAS domain S-box-containing protein
MSKHPAITPDISQQTIRFFEKLLHASADGILIIDAANNILVANEVFCNFFLVKQRDIVETNLYCLLEQCDAALLKRWASFVERVYREGASHNLEFQFIANTQKIRHLNVNASLLKQVAGADVDAILSVWRDVTDLKRSQEELKIVNQYLEQRVATRTTALLTANEELRAEIAERRRVEEKIKHIAFHDVLTSLPNRALFQDRLSLALAHARRNNEMLAILFLDLDRFKVINDSLGHTVGDQLLQGVAERLKKCVREDDTIARLGGDEFIILLPGISHVDHVSAVARKILDTIKQPWHVGGIELFVTASIGVALYPNDGEQIDVLLKNADAAMYRSKEEGRNDYQFYIQSIYAKSYEKMILERDLHRALERKEFVAHYQPQVDVCTGQIIGMEALVRWQHPERGLVLPGEFLSLAEDTRMIVPIDKLTLKTVCEQIKSWQSAGLKPPCVAVNLSAYTFLQQNLVEFVTSTLKNTGIDPGFLELEITEGVAMQNLDTAIQKLNTLRDLGIRITIDDFGTGFSSLFYLKKFPIHKLKISHLFVRDVMSDQNDKMIVSAIIALAKSMKFGVVAEGVESADQLEFLRQQNCKEIQGYLFYRPLCSGKIEKLLLLPKDNNLPSAYSR